MSKRILSFILAGVMILLTFPVAIFAAAPDYTSINTPTNWGFENAGSSWGGGNGFNNIKGMASLRYNGTITEDDNSPWQYAFKVKIWTDTNLDRSEDNYNNNMFYFRSSPNYFNDHEKFYGKGGEERDFSGATGVGINFNPDNHTARVFLKTDGFKTQYITVNLPTDVVNSGVPFR